MRPRMEGVAEKSIEGQKELNRGVYVRTTAASEIPRFASGLGATSPPSLVVLPASEP